MPGFYSRGEYDLAGFCVGVVERSELIDGRTIAPGDALIGLPSSGLHSNGYSLARKVLLDDGKLALKDTPEGLDRPLADALLEPTRIYVKDMLALMKAVKVKGMAHITGSGIPGNLPRCLPDGTRAVLSERTWTRPPIFELIARLGGVARDEMFSTFNMGLGLIAVVAKQDVAQALSLLNARGREGHRGGASGAGPGRGHGGHRAMSGGAGPAGGAHLRQRQQPPGAAGRVRAAGLPGRGGLRGVQRADGVRAGAGAQGGRARGGAGSQDVRLAGGLRAGARGDAARGERGVGVPGGLHAPAERGLPGEAFRGGC